MHADRLNQRFVHLSESCIPLYPPALIYMQLLHEQKSRVHVQNPSRWDTSYLPDEPLCASHSCAYQPLPTGLAEGILCTLDP